VAERKSRDNPMFRRVQESMRVFASRATEWQIDTAVDGQIAWDHFFAPRKT
jgi:TRAP-type mannitol/chloroaromatic compound transport system substrate-binding protein